MSRCICIGLVSSTLAACAGGFSNDVSVTKLSTDPSSAQCFLQGKEYSKTVTTPARVVLPKEAAPVSVSCTRDGHKPFQTELKPLFNEAILNNFLLLSSVGMVVDMVNGHDSKYPDRVHLNLEPTTFSDANARDQWFERYRNHIARKWRRKVNEVSDICNEGSGEHGDCKSNVAAVEAQQMKALHLVEQRRKGARVRLSNTAEQPFTRK